MKTLFEAIGEGLEFLNADMTAPWAGAVWALWERGDDLSQAAAFGLAFACDRRAGVHARLIELHDLLGREGRAQLREAVVEAQKLARRKSTSPLDRDRLNDACAYATTLLHPPTYPNGTYKK